MMKRIRPSAQFPKFIWIWRATLSGDFVTFTIQFLKSGRTILLPQIVSIFVHEEAISAVNYKYPSLALVPVISISSLCHHSFIYFHSFYTQSSISFYHAFFHDAHVRFRSRCLRQCCSPTRQLCHRLIFYFDLFSIYVLYCFDLLLYHPGRISIYIYPFDSV